jgi:hypothetical protein
MPFPITDFVVHVHVPTDTEATDMIALIAPFDCKLVSVQRRFGTASSSGTLMVEKTPSGTDVGSGTDLLTGTMSLAGTADTNVSGTLSTAIGVNRIKKGDGIGLDFGGTLTSLVDLDITLVLRQEKKS